MKALVLIAHGSKKDKSNQEFRDLVKEIKEQSKDKYSEIEASFLEFESPSIEELTHKLYEKNIKDISFYPYFLNSGKHVSIDIPNIIKELENKYQDASFTLLPHFGLSKNISNIICNDI